MPLEVALEGPRGGAVSGAQHLRSKHHPGRGAVRCLHPSHSSLPGASHLCEEAEDKGSAFRAGTGKLAAAGRAHRCVLLVR